MSVRAAHVIGALATRALRREIDTWPKPGLVSRVDSGSHTDMDAALLEHSAQVLQPFFVQLASAGERRATFDELRSIGAAAEQAMLAATGGVNTHRGAIFGLGLLCAAAGLVAADGERARRARPTLGRLVRRHWGAGLGAQQRPDQTSHGAIVQQRYGVGGAREEAAGGFETLYRVALPALRSARRLAPGDANAARVHCCLALMARVEDTNVLFRGGSEGLQFTHTLAQSFIHQGGVGAADWQVHAVRIHHALVARALSPGGCADLLSMALFVDAWVRWRGAARMRRARGLRRLRRRAIVTA